MRRVLLCDLRRVWVLGVVAVLLSYKRKIIMLAFHWSGVHKRSYGVWFM